MSAISGSNFRPTAASFWVLPSKQRSMFSFLVNSTASQHVFISGQREASPEIYIRPTGASGLVRRLNMQKKSTQDGPCWSKLIRCFKFVLL